LKATEEKRIRTRSLAVLVHGSESVPKHHGSGTLPERGVTELGRLRTRVKDMNVGAESKYCNWGDQMKVNFNE
jgi:hypothetical protein